MFNMTESRSCQCPFNLAQLGKSASCGFQSECHHGRTSEDRQRTRPGRNRARWPVDVLVPVVCSAVPLRHLLPGWRPRPRQLRIIRGGGEKAVEDRCPAQPLPSQPLGPLTGSRLTPLTPRSSHSAG
jgi:hypothetical protein